MRDRCVLDALTDLLLLRGPPDSTRSELPVVAPPVRATAGEGAEFIARKGPAWIGAGGAKTAFIAPGSPWENGCCESVNARFRDELLNGKVFTTLREAQILIKRWRRHHNTVRPHSALRYRPPAPESIVPIDQRPIMHSHSTRTSRWGQTKHSPSLTVEIVTDRSRRRR
jgi:transposase InsO family protein